MYRMFTAVVEQCRARGVNCGLSALQEAGTAAEEKAAAKEKAAFAEEEEADLADKVNAACPCCSPRDSSAYHAVSADSSQSHVLCTFLAETFLVAK